MNILLATVIFSVSDPEIVTTCLTLEDNNTKGMLAIMHVINNRAKNNPEKYKNVVLKRWQFSCMNPHTIKGQNLQLLVNKAKSRSNWNTANKIVKMFYAKLIDQDKSFGTHYHVFTGKSKVTPYWTVPKHGGRNIKAIITKYVGTHVFLTNVD